MSVALFVPGWFSIALPTLAGFKRHGSSDQGTARWPWHRWLQTHGSYSTGTREKLKTGQQHLHVRVLDPPRWARAQLGAHVHAFHLQAKTGGAASGSLLQTATLPPAITFGLFVRNLPTLCVRAGIRALPDARALRYILQRRRRNFPKPPLLHLQLLRC